MPPPSWQNTATSVLTAANTSNRTQIALPVQYRYNHLKRDKCTQRDVLNIFDEFSEQDQTVATYGEEKLREGNMNGGLDFGEERNGVQWILLLKVVYII